VYGTYQGRQFAPDVIGVQEVSSQASLNELVTILNAASGSPGDWAAGPFESSPDSNQVLVYRTTKVQVVRGLTIAVADPGTTGQPRDTRRFDIRPVGFTSNAASVGIYVSHLKADSSSNARRLVETIRIRDNAEGLDTNPTDPAGSPSDGLPAGMNFIALGDFNVQSSTQTAYQELVGSQTNNNGRFFDPINTPGSWNNNSTFRFVHTQDPIGGTGGMDDRLDFILVSASLRNNSGLDYIGSHTLPYSSSTWNDTNHSYRCWGNDGSNYGGSIRVNQSGIPNAMVGALIAQDLIDVSTTAGGHLPVYLDLRVPALASVSVPSINFGTVAAGSTATVNITVGNGTNPVIFGNGIENLSYSIGTPSAPQFSAPVGAYSDAPGGGSNVHTITLNTNTAGTYNGTLTLTTNDPDRPTIVISLTGTVGTVNQPPVANAGPDQTVTDTDGDGFVGVTLDGSASTDDGTIASYQWRKGAVNLTGVLATPTALVNLAVGPNIIILRVRDNNNVAAEDTVVVNVLPQPGCNDIDFNNDGLFPDDADLVEFLNVLAGGSCSTDPSPGCDVIDFNNDGLFPDDADLLSFLQVLAGQPC
jgi:endonuclease/exonuclease/phosphatase family metal-dependent hydrolase